MPVRQFKNSLQEKCTKFSLVFEHSSLDQLMDDGGQELQKDIIFFRLSMDPQYCKCAWKKWYTEFMEQHYIHPEN